MDDQETYYQVLGVSETATQDEVKKAADSLLKKYHPDHVPEVAKEIEWIEKEANERTARVLEARRVLTDRYKRPQYDELLKAIRQEEQDDDESSAAPTAHSQSATNWAGTATPPPSSSNPPPPPPSWSGQSSSQPPNVAPSVQQSTTQVGHKGVSRPVAVFVGILAGFSFAKAMSVFASAVIANSGIRETPSFDVTASLWIGGLSIFFGIMAAAIFRRNSKAAWMSGICLLLGIGIGRMLILVGLPSSNHVGIPVGNGTATTPSSEVGPKLLEISSVSSILPQQNQKIRISGRGFGELSPYNGDSDFIRVSDLTKGWNAGWTKDPGADKIGLQIGNWTDTSIEIGGFVGNYGGNRNSLDAGDLVELRVWNAQSGSGPAIYKVHAGAFMPSDNSSGTPQITSINMSPTDHPDSFVIIGKGFGTRAPYSGDSDVIKISNLTRNWNAGASQDSPPDQITVVVDRWTDSEIDVGGFGGLYGQGSYNLGTGDRIRLEIWNAESHIGPAVYTAAFNRGLPQDNQIGTNPSVGPIILPTDAADKLLIQKTMPTYPPIAKAMRVYGTVVLQAKISKTGLIEELQVVSGPAMLQQSASDAVKTWRYRPYLLNNEPVEIETTISVTFTLGLSNSPESNDNIQLPQQMRSPYRPGTSPSTVEPLVIRTDADRRGTLVIFNDHVEYRDEGMGTNGGRAPYGPNAANNFSLSCSEIENLRSYGFRPVIFGSFQVVISAHKKNFHIPTLHGDSVVKTIREKCGIANGAHD